MYIPLKKNPPFNKSGFLMNLIVTYYERSSSTVT